MNPRGKIIYSCNSPGHRFHGIVLRNLRFWVHKLRNIGSIRALGIIIGHFVEGFLFLVLEGLNAHGDEESKGADIHKHIQIVDGVTSLVNLPHPRTV